MKKIMKVISVGAGIAVATWALRDRFTSLPSPSETTQPPFREAEPVVENADPDDLTQIHGVGPVYARRLVESGITSFSEFFKSSSGSIGDITGASSDKVSHWLDQSDSLEK